MNQKEFEKLRTVQMEIMDEVHRVCEKNKIIYYIIGGTALGAKRHGGYIPWDLDIDIAMPRADYEKFAQVCDTELHHRFEYRNFKNTSQYNYPHALVCVKNTFLSVKSYIYNPKEKNLGIYLDIFPLDKAPEEVSLQNKQIEEIERIKKLKLLKRAYCYKNDFKNKVVKKLISAAMFWTDTDKLNAQFDAVCRKYENTDSNFLCSMASHYKYTKQCMPSEVYGKPTLVKFEDREYYAPEMLDDYLTRIFGDYMKLPPEEERHANLGIFDKVVFDD